MELEDQEEVPYQRVGWDPPREPPGAKWDVSITANPYVLTLTVEFPFRPRLNTDQVGALQNAVMAHVAEAIAPLWPDGTDYPNEAAQIRRATGAGEAPKSPVAGASPGAGSSGPLPPETNRRQYRAVAGDEDDIRGDRGITTRSLGIAEKDLADILAEADPPYDWGRVETRVVGDWTPLEVEEKIHDHKDCERELAASWEFDRFRCTPKVWTCSCGRHYVHVCDEAEGCSWVLDDAEEVRPRPSRG